MDLNKRFVIDLSQAQSPSDIVFELSNVIENQEASNKKVWLKLGDVTLNQSQLLSINSLISSINSTLSLIESQSAQTELAAATLGINTKDVEEEIQDQLEELEAEAQEPLQDEPSEQYIPMVEHIEEQIEEPAEEETVAEEAIEEPIKEYEQSITEVNEVESQEVEPEEEPKTETEIQNNADSEVDADIEVEAQTEAEHNEEIQEHLDSIFDSETKLENILSEDKDIHELKKCPLTKEEGEFEIPDDIMTDEDYEILQMSTQYHKQTVRSGQVIKSNGNVVIIGDCHPGCEIHAAGDITVWGILAGIAQAGCKGNTKAKIRALNLNAIQLRIADSFARRPDHIKNIYVEKTNTFTPEEARNVNGSIVILKINEK